MKPYDISINEICIDIIASYKKDFRLRYNKKNDSINLKFPNVPSSFCISGEEYKEIITEKAKKFLAGAEELDKLYESSAELRESIRSKIPLDKYRVKIREIMDKYNLEWPEKLTTN